MFEKCEYTLTEIRGDYGILTNNTGERPVALFLLPGDIEIGCTIIYENLTYRVE